MRRIAGEQRCFHWHLEFPDVFDGSADEGFDCVLGNPPWEQVELKEEEFFTARAPDVVSGRTGAERKRHIEDLATTDPALYRLYVEARLGIDRQRRFLQTSGRYPLTGRGRTNVYSVFAESDRTLISPYGRAGIIVPTGIATDDTNKTFFADVVARRALASLYDFENRNDIFPGVGHGRYKFSLLTLTGDYHGPDMADLVCFALRPEDLLDAERHFMLSPAEFALINPNTRTLPIFRSQRDAELTGRMYRAAPVLVDESGAESVSSWGISFRQGFFNMTSDSHLFHTRVQLEAQGYALGSGTIFRTPGQWEYVPLYEGKLFWHFDHRYASFDEGIGDDDARDITVVEHEDPNFLPLPRYWVPAATVERILEGKAWNRQWLLAFRDISNAANERTFVSSLVPRTGAGNMAPLLFIAGSHCPRVTCLLSNVNTIPFDYIARQKTGGTHLNFFIVKQLPVLPPETYERRAGDERLAWIIHGASRWSRAGPVSIRGGQFDLTRLITYHEGDRTGKTSPLPPSGPESA